MAKIIQGHEQIKQSTKDAQKWLHKHTCQLIHHNQATNQLEAWASALLLNLQGTKILLSAAHVFTKDSLRNLSIFYAEENIAIEGTLFGMTDLIPENKFDAGRNLDFAYVVLSKSLAQSIEKHYSFLIWPNIRDSYMPAPNEQYVAFGYPINKTKIIQKRGGSITFEPLYFHCGGAASYAYDNRYNRRDHIIVRKNRKNMVIANQNLGLTPNLKGMSGGGLWCFTKPLDVDIKHGNLKLVGLLTEFDSRFIYSTNINCVLSFIKLQRYHLKS